MALISVVIPTIGNFESLERCLSSLAGQHFSGCFELIVIFNPPNPTLEKIVAEKWGARVFSNKIVGANRARNLGIENALGDVIVFMDDDCEASDPSFLQKHWDFHQTRTDITGMGGNYLLPKDAGNWAKLYYKQQQVWLLSGERPGYFSDLILGGNFSIKRKKIGSLRFTNDLVYGGTETDFIFQLVANGHKVIFSEEPTVFHHVTVGAIGLFRKAFLQGRGAKSLFLKKHYGVARTILSQGEEADYCEEQEQFFSGVYQFFFQLGYLVGNERGRSWLSLGWWGLSLIFRLVGSWVKRRFFALWRTAELLLYVSRESRRKGN